VEPVVKYGPVVRWRESAIEVETDQVVTERPLAVVVAGRPVMTLMCSPGLERELAVGFCLTQGIAPPGAKLTAGPFQGDRVEVVCDPAPSVEALAVPGFKSASGVAYPDPDDESLAVHARRVGRASVRVELATLAEMTGHMSRRQSHFAATGGTHAAALAEPDGRLVVTAEDVGRHNALDKAVGAALLGGLDLAGRVLVLSGRTSVEMMLKAGRAGVACVVSVSAPTRLALEMARRLGLTYAGFARPGGVNVYTGFERIFHEGRPLTDWIAGRLEDYKT
jgi:FdhD protein